MWIIVAENPVMLTFMIGVVVAALFYGWLQTGDRRIAWGSVGVGLLIPVVLLISNWIETDREQILHAIHTTAAAVEQNDFESAVMVIEDRKTRARALSELPNYDFHRVAVRNIQIKMVRGSAIPEASVDLDASVTASLSHGGVNDVTVPRRVILTFQKQPDDSWKVIDYSHRPLIGGPDNLSTRGI